MIGHHSGDVTQLVMIKSVAGSQRLQVLDGLLWHLEAQPKFLGIEMELEVFSASGFPVLG